MELDVVFIPTFGDGDGEDCAGWVVLVIHTDHGGFEHGGGVAGGQGVEGGDVFEVELVIHGILIAIKNS